MQANANVTISDYRHIKEKSMKKLFIIMAILAMLLSACGTDEGEAAIEAAAVEIDEALEDIAEEADQMSNDPGNRPNLPDIAYSDCSVGIGPGNSLAGCSFNDSNLSGSQLAGADLSQFTCTDSNMGQSDFSEAILVGASWDSCNLSDSDFSNADLTLAKVSSSNLSNTIFVRANLRFADLSGGNLTNANFSGADLTGANLSGSNLNGVNFTGATVVGIDLSATVMNGAVITAEQLDYAASVAGAVLPDGTFGE